MLIPKRSEKLQFHFAICGHYMILLIGPAIQQVRKTAGVVYKDY